ncbi:hypothetical protein Poly24_31470 [Rosistilla carotiformis]|uniref:Uncharacterized protein n=1 Tax=Rosistilla carotiformis TaxID=2528017 RepID=A0A518JV54_9BACT|nr:hypothetical protein Poly24_31470 [Rosistilla carotiformis]
MDRWPREFAIQKLPPQDAEVFRIHALAGGWNENHIEEQAFSRSLLQLPTDSETDYTECEIASHA